MPETDMQIMARRLSQLGPLATGSHQERSAACVMEAVAHVAGEPWSDEPDCVCPVLGAFLRTWNDALPDDERDTLMRPLVLRMAGTKADIAVEDRRSIMAMDWLIRVCTPAWLRLAQLNAAADILAGLPEITGFSQIPSILGPIKAARRDAMAAMAAVMAAARGTAVAATWDAAVAAALAAALAAAVAAVAATWDAAVAAVAATWDAAVAAALAALSETRRELQQSALRLLDRMIECEATVSNDR